MRSGKDKPLTEPRPDGTPAETPRLTVVVASTRRSEDLERCLEALDDQVQGTAVEVIVVDGSRSATEALRARYGWARFRSFPEATPLPRLWGSGIQQASGAVIAVLDATTLVGEDWISALLEAHASSEHPIIGGVVEPLEDAGWTDWTAYFCDYAQFMEPLSEGAAQELPGNNVAFTRELLQKGRSAYVAPAFWKTYWCHSLQEEGIRLWADPSMVVYNAKSYRLLPFLVRRFHHGRCFGGMRGEEMSALKRAAFAAGTPALPLLFLYRMIRAVWPKGRHRVPFLLTLPLSLLAVTGWAVGEGWGYLAGAGESCRRIY